MYFFMILCIHLEEMNEEISNDLSCLENDLDIVVISTGHSFYKSNEFIKILERKKELFILDTVTFCQKKISTIIYNT